MGQYDYTGTTGASDYSGQTRNDSRNQDRWGTSYQSGFRGENRRNDDRSWFGDDDDDEDYGSRSRSGSSRGYGAQDSRSATMGSSRSATSGSQRSSYDDDDRSTGNDWSGSTGRSYGGSSGQSGNRYGSSASRYDDDDYSTSSGSTRSQRWGGSGSDTRAVSEGYGRSDYRSSNASGSYGASDYDATGRSRNTGTSSTRMGSSYGSSRDDDDNRSSRMRSTYGSSRYDDDDSNRSDRMTSTYGSTSRYDNEDDDAAYGYGSDDNREGLAIDETRTLIASSKVEGTAVYDRDGSRMGTIHNFMVNKRSGQVDYAVLSFGGFLGMGTRYYPLPWDMLEYDTSVGGYMVDMDEDDLDEAPSYRSGEEPDFGDRYGRYVYSYYGMTY